MRSPGILRRAHVLIGLSVATPLALALAGADCLAPTEITLVLQTNVKCSDWDNATITIGSSRDIETKAPTTSTTTCDANGNLGTLVLTPSGSDSADVAIKVVGGENRDPSTCMAPAYGTGCIVARRDVPYLKHTPLRLIILLESSCDGIVCSPPTTCNAGKCVNDVVTPSACENSGCDASVLQTPAVCGNVDGLQFGAPWPMRGYCPTHQSRSPFIGPQTPALLWKGAATGEVSGLPSVAADGTVYVGTNGGHLYAFAPDGGERWAFPVGGNINNPGPAIGANGSITTPCSDTRIYNVAPDGGLRWSFSTGSDMSSSPVIGSNGTLYVGGGYQGTPSPLGQSLLGINPADGGVAFAYATGAAVQSSPAIGLDGSILFGGQDGSLYALTPTGALKWTIHLGTAVSSPTIGDDGTIYVMASGTLNAVSRAGSLIWSKAVGASSDIAVGSGGRLYYVGPGGDSGSAYFLHATDPGGNLLWLAQTGQSPHYSPSIGADGTIYVASFDGKVYAISSTGTLRWTFLTGGSLNSAIAIADHVLYVGSADNNLYAIGP